MTGLFTFSYVASKKAGFKQIFWFALLMRTVKKLVCLFNILNGPLYGGCNAFDLAESCTTVHDCRSLGIERFF